MSKIVGSDLDMIVLEEYEKPFIVDGILRDERIAARTGRCVKQVWAILEKKRMGAWIDCGVTLRSGWLTDSGVARLNELRAIRAPKGEG